MARCTERTLEQRETLYTIAALWQRWHQQRFMQVLSNLSILHSLDSAPDLQIRAGAMGHLQRLRNQPHEMSAEGRDPHRISLIIEEVRSYWERFPEVPLCRLMKETVVKGGWGEGYIADIEDTDDDDRKFYGQRARGISLQSAIQRKLQQRPAERLSSSAGQGDVRPQREEAGSAHTDISREGFQALHHLLIAEYPQQCQLQHRFLLLLNRPESKTTLDVLAELAHRACEEVQPQMREIMGTDWQRIALHALASIQRTCIRLFNRKLNPRQFLLKVDDGSVRWGEDSDKMPRYALELGQ